MVFEYKSVTEWHIRIHRSSISNRARQVLIGNFSIARIDLHFGREPVCNSKADNFPQWLKSIIWLPNWSCWIGSRGKKGGHTPADAQFINEGQQTLLKTLSNLGKLYTVLFLQINIKKIFASLLWSLQPWMSLLRTRKKIDLLTIIIDKYEISHHHPTHFSESFSIRTDRVRKYALFFSSIRHSNVHFQRRHNRFQLYF